MKNIQRIGQTAIRAGNENQEPCVVFVSGLNSMDLVVSRVLNTGNLVFDNKDESTLIDFEYKTFAIMRAKWFIDESDRTKQRWIKILNELEAQMQS